mgnify:CR=1 FL=1
MYSISRKAAKSLMEQCEKRMKTQEFSLCIFLIILFNFRYLNLNFASWRLCVILKVQRYLFSIVSI